MTASPRLFIKRFYTKYKPDPSDGAKMIAEDWIEYGPIGSIDKSTTVIRVRDLKPQKPLATGNPSSEMGWMRWQIIEQAYSSWKLGHEAPLEGTPLAAWNGLSPEQAEILKSRGIRTLEEMVELTDAHVERIPLPMRDLIRQGKQFLDAADANRTTKALAEKDAQIRSLADKNDELSGQVAALLGKVDQLADVLASLQAEKDAPAKTKKKAA